MPGLWAAVGRCADDQPLHCSCPLSARLDAPTPLLPPGFILLLIGGGCLLYPPLCRRLAGVYIAGMWPRGTRESNGRGPAATTAMWPAVLTGGRPSLEAAGQLPAGSALTLCRSASGGNIIRLSGRPPAGGGQTRGSGWMRLPPHPRAAARTEAG